MPYDRVAQAMLPPPFDPAERARQQRSALGGLFNEMFVQPVKDVYNYATTTQPGESDAGKARDKAIEGALGMLSPMGKASIFALPLLHGSPRAGLPMLAASRRGPLGPGVYTSPMEGITKRYGEHTYEVAPPNTKDVFQGLGDRYGSFEDWKKDVSRLVAAAEPDKREAVKAITDKMWTGDGYPMYGRIAQLYGGDEAAQALYKRAGFEGIGGHVDGPEVVLFGSQGLRRR